jgi:hypothetical protein
MSGSTSGQDEGTAVAAVPSLTTSGRLGGQEAAG